MLCLHDYFAPDIRGLSTLPFAPGSLAKSHSQNDDGDNDDDPTDTNLLDAMLPHTSRVLTNCTPRKGEGGIMRMPRCTRARVHGACGGPTMCLALQVLSVLMAQDASVLQRNAFASEHLLLPLDFTTGATQSRLLGQVSVRLGLCLEGLL